MDNRHAMHGEVHEISGCPGYWLASVCQEDGRLLFERGSAMDNVFECRSEAEGLNWLHREARRRGAKLKLLK